jgi:HEAT repeat protein
MDIPKIRTWHLLGIIAATAAYIAVFQFRWTVEDEGYATIRRLRSLDAAARVKAANDLRSLRPIERRAISPVTEMLFDSEPIVRVAAAEALLYLINSDGVNPVEDEAVVGPVKAALASALGDPDLTARLAIADTLARLRAEPKVIVPTLLEFATSRDGRTHGNAVTLLGLYLQKSEPALAAVLAALNDPDPVVRQLAIQSLGQGAIFPKPVPEPIMERIKTAILGMSGDPAQPVRLGAIGMLTRIAQRTSTEDSRVIRFLDDPDVQVRLAACSYHNWWSVPTKRASEFVPAYERTLKDPDAAVRSVSAYALSRFGIRAESSLPALRGMLDNPDKNDDRNAITSAIATIEAEVRKFREETLPATIAELADADPMTRALAAGRLEEFGPMASKAVPDLVRCLGDREADVRRASASALGQLGPDAAVAIPKLAELAKSDDDQRVRQAATISQAILSKPDDRAR